MSYQAKYKGTTVVLEAGRYGNGQKALQFFGEDGIPQFVATVAIDTSLTDNEIAIKDYSENTGVLEWLISKGLILPPHRMFASGWVEIPICYLTPDAESIFY